MQTELYVFDAYGTLFDVTGAARAVALSDARVAPFWPVLAEDWRRKQLEYTWLRTIMGAHCDFLAVTADALDWALEAQGLHDGTVRAALLTAYRRLPCFPEVPAALEALARRGKRMAILSNGDPAMLAEAVASSGLEGRFEAVLSVEAVGVYKPDPHVYAMVETATGVLPQRVMFISSNGWDVAGAARFGFSTTWVNRAGAPIDRLSHGPARIIPDLSSLEALA